MKKYFWILIVLTTSLSGCIAHIDIDGPGTASTANGSTQITNDTQATLDDVTIQSYLKKNGLTASKDPSGLYYKIVNAGTGAYPIATSTITVNYTTSLLSTGVVFDSSTGFKAQLSSLITGWQIGIPFIKPGGSIILYIPSGLAYGSSTTGPVPANSIIICNIDLTSFI